MKKMWCLSLALLVFTGCQKHELSDLELVKIAREYMSIMNPGQVEKASASVSAAFDYNLSKDSLNFFKEVHFYIDEKTVNNGVSINQWIVRVEGNRAVKDVFLTQEKMNKEIEDYKSYSVNDFRNHWGNYLRQPDWVKTHKANSQK